MRRYRESARERERGREKNDALLISDCVSPSRLLLSFSPPSPLDANLNTFARSLTLLDTITIRPVLKPKLQTLISEL